LIAIKEPGSLLAESPRRNAFSRSFHWLERCFDRAFGPGSNPLRQLGALGFHCFWIVTVTGIYVYVFFDTSVIGAYQSLETLSREQRYVGGVMRSMHRYASDGFVVVMLLHLARELAYGRFWGFRWFSWVSGVPLLWFAFASGIGGYWLVWDQLAQFIGLATTEWFGALPGFDISMVRNFLVADTLSDRFFSLLVFMHIALPLFLLLGMWIHIQRITGARTQPEGQLGWATLCLFVLLSLVKPAVSQAPVDLSVEPLSLDFDWFYLFAYPGIYRYSATAVWYALGGLTVLLCAVPWLVRIPRLPVAKVDPANCNGCGRCFADCPYGAVVMQPRTGPRFQYKLAVVLTDLCAGCGLCAGACPSSTPFRSTDVLATGIDMPQLPVGELRASMERAIEKLSGPAKVVVFGCDHGAPVQALAGPAVAALSLPCAGMLPPSFIEYALRGGADGIMIVGCAEGDCEYRFGIELTRQRIEGAREPHLRSSVPHERVNLFWPYDSESDRVGYALEAFQARLRTTGDATHKLPRRKQREVIHG
jgi:coenzyme F420-reducing hydrogenase delta subunit/ferredoxin